MTRANSRSSAGRSRTPGTCGTHSRWPPVPGGRFVKRRVPSLTDCLDQPDTRAKPFPGPWWPCVVFSGRSVTTIFHTRPNCRRRAYADALRRLDAWLDGCELDNAALAAYLASCTTPAALPRAPRCRSPRRASARNWPGSPLPPASGRPGCSPGTGGPPPNRPAEHNHAPPSRRLGQRQHPPSTFLNRLIYCTAWFNGGRAPAPSLSR